MWRYIIRRLLLMIPVLFGLTVAIFVILRIVPGDVAMQILTQGEASRQGRIDEAQLAALRKQLGTDRPLYVQYASWIWGVLRFDFGRSIHTHQPIADAILERFPVSMQLAIMTSIISLIIAIPIGVLSAMRQDTWVDYLFRVVTIGGIAAPGFFVATVIIFVLLRFFHWLPPLGFTYFWQDPLRNLTQLIWPALALGYAFSAVTSRMTRSSMLEVWRQDYIRTAWAKGLREGLIVSRHALKNALLPVVTIAGLQLAFLLGGTVIMEAIFALPGMGTMLIDGIVQRDYPVVQAVVVIFGLIIAVANLVVDILYGWLDPRIRYS